jgi:hypothetical protein
VSYTTATVPWTWTAALAVLTFVLGLLVPRVWMTRKESKDIEQTNYTNSAALVEKHDAVRAEYIRCLKVYCDASDVTFQMFSDIMESGIRYFDQVSFLCDAILSDKVDHQVRDNTLLPKIKGVADRTLPHHYETLQNIAAKKGFPYTGKLRRSDYPGVFAVTEKFGLSSDPEED